MTKYPTDLKYPEQQSAEDQKQPRKRSPLFWVGVVIVIIVLLLGVATLLKHILSHQGTVTSVSSTSITIKPSDEGSVEKFITTNKTKEQSASNKSPTAYNAKDIHDGEVITVVTDGPGSKQAGVILLYAQP
ncbi:MAG: hypothetical protein ACREF5_00060 [Candidatus Saccharimonadales bacterium]